MSSEFYSYIAKSIINFFQSKVDTIRPGERYCLKLDTQEMVEGVDQAIRDNTASNKIEGFFQYDETYSTHTIKLAPELEVVVASKINGMTDDFLATLRNAELSSKQFPILMITDSAIDSITSGTGDLSANGMPFHADTIVSKIKEDIKKAQFSPSERELLSWELEKKESDRYSDKSSLFEYSNILSILERSVVNMDDYPQFSLLPDPQGSNLEDKKKIRERLKKNNDYFKEIDRSFKYGNIEDDLKSKYGGDFIKLLKENKKEDRPWYTGLNFEIVDTSRAEQEEKADNSLSIEDEDFSFYSHSPMEYTFVLDSTVYIRNDGESKAKSRNKNILIFNPDNKEQINIDIHTNIAVKELSLQNCEGSVTGKLIQITVDAKGCTFAQATIEDPNKSNIKYKIKVCILDTKTKYLENILTCFTLNVKKSAKKSCICVYNVKNELVVNPGCEQSFSEKITENEVHICNYDQTMILIIAEGDVDSEKGYLSTCLKNGGICIPLHIMDERIKPVELTGTSAFKWKFEEKAGFTYQDQNRKIIRGTKEFFAKEKFQTLLTLEFNFVEYGWVALDQVEDGTKEHQLDIPSKVREAYKNLIEEYKKNKTIPSLCYYSGEILKVAEDYVAAVEEVFDSIPSGESLTKNKYDILFLGCVFNKNDDSIWMGPLHPLNIAYQIRLLEEEGIGSVRDNLVEKLSPLYLIPYIKNEKDVIYSAVEQKYAPEWRRYTPVSNEQIHGSRSFIAKLVFDKIGQYKKYFPFYFEDIGNNNFIINLINMGDCQEIFHGLLDFYADKLKNNIDPDQMLNFTVNIYAKNHVHNRFLLLSDQKKLYRYIEEQCPDEDTNELVLIMTSRIRCYYRNPKDDEYEYSHLAFYEMSTSNGEGTNRMDLVSTGISLEGLTSGVPSSLNSGWYKTGFGTKYAPDQSRLIHLASQYNALFRIAYSGSSYDKDSCIFTQLDPNDDILNKIYKSSNWVVFVSPKVDLSFFNRNSTEEDLMIIHYSDQYTSSGGYDDITVTQKSKQYCDIIREHLKKKGVEAGISQIHHIIDLFNAINGSWLLKLITAKKPEGAIDSYFSREKMSILSAIELCMAYYSHPDIVWIPISLEELLRVSGGAGLSQKDGLLSAKNLGFEHGVTCDDILLVGIEGPNDNIKLYLHPVEVKIGKNPTSVIEKAEKQVINTYRGFWSALWPEEGRNRMECKLSRNFFIQIILNSCEKMKLYDIYPDGQWDLVIDTFRQNLLNENYRFSDEMDQYIGKGTIISFGTDVLEPSGRLSNGVCFMEFPENKGSEYMIQSVSDIEKDLCVESGRLPSRLKDTKVKAKESEKQYSQEKEEVVTEKEKNKAEEVERVAGRENENKDMTEDNIEGNDKSGERHDDLEDSREYTTEKDQGKKAPDRKGMQILFGTDIETGRSLYWCPNDTEQVFHTNTGIIGTMGTGKTQFTKSMITQLYNQQQFNIGNEPLGILIFDYKGDYNESKPEFVSATNAQILKPYQLPFNPLALVKTKVYKPLLPIHTANAFKDTISKVYNLGPIQENALFQCILDAYTEKGIIPGDQKTWDKEPPTFNDVYKIYSADEDIKKNDSLAAAMDKLHMFEIFERDPSKTKSLFDLLNGVVVIDLSGYDNDIQTLIVAITLDLFYSQMQTAGSSKLEGRYRQLTKFILVDEADNFMSKGFPSLKKIMKEGREFGVGTILSTQFLKHFGSGDDDYSKYVLTWVVHNVSDLKNSDVDFVFKTAPKSKEEQTLFNDIKGLQKHHSIVKIGNKATCYIKDKAFWELYQETNK